MGTYVLPGTYGVVGVNVNPMYNLNHRFNVGASLDMYYDHSANLVVDEEKKKSRLDDSDGEVKVLAPEDYLTTPAWYKQVTAGVSVRGEYVMPYFTINFGIGRNFINAKSGVFNGFYELLALKIGLATASMTFSIPTT